MGLSSKMLRKYPQIILQPRSAALTSSLFQLSLAFFFFKCRITEKYLRGFNTRHKKDISIIQKSIKHLSEPASEVYSSLYISICCYCFILTPVLVGFSLLFGGFLRAVDGRRIGPRPAVRYGGTQQHSYKRLRREEEGRGGKTVKQ